MNEPPMLLEELTYSIIGAFFEAYNTLGYGFLEHLCLKALEHELMAKGHHVRREVWVAVMYKGRELGKQRLDMVVDDRIVIEVKSTHDLPRNATRQLFNYLRATNLEVGLLLHFGPEPKLFRVSRPKPGGEQAKSTRQLPRASPQSHRLSWP